MTYLRPKYSAQPIVASLLLLIISACTESAQPEPEPTRPAQYELTEVRYFLKPGDHIDTVTVPLKGLQVQNASNFLATQQVEVRADDLMKTSQFEVESANLLPADVVLSNLDVQVPEERIDRYFEKTFTLSAVAQQKPYGSFAQQTLTVNSPAHSTIDISRRIDAYYLTCSFEGLLTNKTTGQRYPLRGKWKGLLRYNNLSTTLTEHAL